MSGLTKCALPIVCGIAITAGNRDAARRQIAVLAKSQKPSTVFTMNLNHAVQLQRDQRFRAAYGNADVVTADGWPIAWFASRRAAHIQRTTGADLLLPLIDDAAKNGVPVFLFGTSPDVIARVGAHLKSRTANAIDIAGSMSPSRSFDPEGPEADAAIEKIRRSGAKLCFVAVGAPKQEIFADYARSKGLACCLVCVGAALDFIAGAQVRAPALFRDNGLEWTWRLATNPTRMAWRYAECTVMFAYLLATETRRQSNEQQLAQAD